MAVLLIRSLCVLGVLGVLGVLAAHGVLSVLDVPGPPTATSFSLPLPGTTHSADDDAIRSDVLVAVDIHRCHVRAAARRPDAFISRPSIDGTPSCELSKKRKTHKPSSYVAVVPQLCGQK